MKQFLLIVIFFLFGLTAFSQLKVSEVESDSAALRLVKEVNYSKTQAPQWHHFYLTQGDEWNAYYNLTKKQQGEISETNHYLKWVKEDINNDGKEDLIVNGYIARKPGDWSTATFKVIVFLSQPGNLYIEQDLLDSHSAKYPAYFNINTIDGKKYIILYRWRVALSEKNKDLPITIDTLTYKNPIDAFVNYYKELRQPDIAKVQYKVLDDFAGSYHEGVLENDGKKKVDLSIYTKQSTDKSPQLLKAKLSKNLWMQLDTLVRSVPEKDYKLNHPPQLTKDLLPTALTIFYSDGSKVRIINYGDATSYTLSAIDQLFESIIQNTFDQMVQRRQYVNEMMENNW
ncbi:hypothetical protein [Arachidicoccus sp.]|uniref:hypothetical protein n=1 Tax=Arachidicoccus sp. TaxID=1872624 RepID=UPI003D239E46